MEHHKKFKPCSNLQRIGIGIDEWEKFQVNGIDKIINKITEENFLKLRKIHPYSYKKYTGHQIDKTKKGKKNPHRIL